jgi:hypothetical protein
MAVRNNGRESFPRDGVAPRAGRVPHLIFVKGEAPLREGENLTRFYFNELLIDVNWPFRLVPRPFTTAMIASAIPAAIKPYSIAVAPDSSDKNFKKLRFTCASVGVG